MPENNREIVAEWVRIPNGMILERYEVDGVPKCIVYEKETEDCRRMMCPYCKKINDIPVCLLHNQFVFPKGSPPTTRYCDVWSKKSFTLIVKEHLSKWYGAISVDTLKKGESPRTRCIFGPCEKCSAPSSFVEDICFNGSFYYFVQANPETYSPIQFSFKELNDILRCLDVLEEVDDPACKQAKALYVDKLRHKITGDND
jgi:hypothetical protein